MGDNDYYCVKYKNTQITLFCGMRAGTDQEETGRSDLKKENMYLVYVFFYVQSIVHLLFLHLF